MRPAVLWLGTGAIAFLLAACPSTPEPTPSPPATPTGLIAVPGDEQVTLTWDANTEADLAHYNVHRGTDPDDLEAIAEVAAGTETFLDQDVDNNVTYFYAINAENEAGQTSNLTDPVDATPSDTPDPDDPPEVTDTQPADNDTDVALNTNIRVTFSKAMDRSATEGAFSVAPAVDCDFTWTQGDERLTCNPQVDLDTNTEYTVTISTDAEDTDGNNLESAHTFSFTTGEDVLQQCVFGDSEFDNCVFAP